MDIVFYSRMQNSANTYLLFLACSDFLVILTGLFIFWIGEKNFPNLYKNKKRKNWSAGNCKPRIIVPYDEQSKYVRRSW
ncbi:unnamed protein product [Strongylus vulgaris]|uniref:Uncharacterized protein n=1 Tax=Strongylus vulgaris TaxID=40348 RepID=A0A3P7JUV3_STRVU|nr:unnamed protein product [Strongylus vulgaris]